MEEIREAALAYYEAGTQEQKQLAWAFFQTLDVDGDGTVSIQEFVNFLRGRGYPNDTFDLCSACYRGGRRIIHQHAADDHGRTRTTKYESDNLYRNREYQPSATAVYTCKSIF
ncbi:hypothetical protein AAG906_017010 [Vitis piasezkii]